MIYIALGVISLLLLWLALYALANATQAQFRRISISLLILLGGLVALYLALSGRMALATIVGSGLLATLLPRWRAYMQTHAGGYRNATNMDMDEAEACEILGVSPNASKQDIERAYRELMKKLHPDVGGGDWFAKRLSAAREFLLRKHQ